MAPVSDGTTPCCQYGASEAHVGGDAACGRLLGSSWEPLQAGSLDTGRRYSAGSPSTIGVGSRSISTTRPDRLLFAEQSSALLRAPSSGRGSHSRVKLLREY